MKTLKKTYIILALQAVMMMITTTACKKEKAEQTPITAPTLLSLSTDKVELKAGATTEVEIKGGSSKLLCILEKPSVARATIKGNHTLIIEGIAAGEEELTIKDRLLGTTKKVSIVVKEDLYITGLPSSFTMFVGDSKHFKLDGKSLNITATTDNDKVLQIVTAEGNNLMIKAVAKGEATITITDKANGINLTAKATTTFRPLTIREEDEEFSVMLNKEQALNVTSGNGTYEGTVSPTAIAEVTATSSGVLVRGLKKGEGTLTLKDVASGETKAIKLIVRAEELSLAELRVEVPLNTQENVKITSGNGVYTLAVKEGGDHFSAEIEGTQIKIEGKSEGSGTITVTDVATGETKDLSVTVIAKELEFDSENVEVPENSDEQVEIRSGNGKYSIKENNNSHFTAELQGTVITVHGKSKGEGTITVTDVATSKTKEIKVKVVDEEEALDQDGEEEKSDSVSDNPTGENKKPKGKGESSDPKLIADKKEVTVKRWGSGTTLTLSIPENEQEEISFESIKVEVKDPSIANAVKSSTPQGNKCTVTIKGVRTKGSTTVSFVTTDYNLETGQEIKKVLLEIPVTVN